MPDVMTFTPYGPKGGLSPTLGDPCSLCGQPLALGDYTTLVPRALDRRFANNAEVHWDCAVKLVDTADEKREP